MPDAESPTLLHEIRAAQIKMQSDIDEIKAGIKALLEMLDTAEEAKRIAEAIDEAMRAGQEAERLHRRRDR